MADDFNLLYKYREPPSVSEPEKLRNELKMKAREHFFASIMRREGLSPQDIRDGCRTLDIELCSQSFAMISVKMASWEKTFYNTDDSIPERVKRFVRFIILNVTEELLGEKSPVYSMVLDGNYCCVVDLGVPDGEYSTMLENAAGLLERTMAENCGVVAQIDASEVVQGLASLADAYDHINDIERYRQLLQNDKPLLTWADISREIPIIDHFKCERRMLELVRKGDYGRVKEQLLALMDQMFTELPNYHTAQFLFARTQTLVRTLIDTAKQMTGSDVFWQELDPNRLISGAASVKDLEGVIECLFECVDEYGKDGAEMPKWFHQLLAVLDKEYADPNINVNTLADSLGITATHLSRTFRKFRGIGLPDYIHVLRISAAKRYIAEGYSVKKVTELVGYANQLTMSRAFKKFEGHTPGQYVAGN